MTSTIPANESAVSPTLRITVWLLLLLFAAILGGGILAKTEVVARGAGKLVPVARVQIVQPLADGKVVELAVAEGQSVAKGDILVRLDPTSAQSDIQRIQAEIDQQSLHANVAAAVFSSLMARDPAAAGFMEYGIAEFRGRRGINPNGSAVGEDLVRAALGSKLNQVSGVARADFVGEQEKRLPWSTTPQSLFDAFAEKIRRVPKGYGENRSFLRRETLMDIRSTFGFASITERFSLIPRSKS
ncbi:hypothetical protein ASD54_01620 [Rhizobium sp. Root149]|uniref:biotin/lipoyl-binding protein n=1 Tax=Rhizobium sp. Root149 TaxID=1736473 RepID=UPI000714901D|nr:biotin/lipoyl-binding protein [Rhizobium sp. Root149]KQZ63108.1 hypothetical protein ASD54_01620 [Rhizobium sp. Root149]